MAKVAQQLSDLEDIYEDEQETVERAGAEGQGREGIEEDAFGATEYAGEEQEAGDDEDVTESAPRRRPDRFAQLAKENAELRRRMVALEQPRWEAPRQPQTFEESEDQFQARIQLLSLEDRIAEKQARSERRNSANVQLMMFQQRDWTDKSTYDAKAVMDPVYRRFAAAVEAKQQELLQQGQWNNREAILKYLIGEHRLTNRGKPARQRQEAQTRVQQATTQPSRSGSDVPRGGGKRQLSEREQRVRRLDGVNI